jgi:tetraacyldisaccharide 4'-kinase
MDATLQKDSPSDDTSRLPGFQGPAPGGHQRWVQPSIQGWLTAHLPQAWLRRGPLSCALWPVSLLYAALVRGRRWMYDFGAWPRIRIPVPVVVVGNVVAGGSGKTPVVIAVVEHLRAQGWRPGVVSRGHGRLTRECLEVFPDMPAQDCGDEPLLIRQRCQVPVFVASLRTQAAQALLETHPDINIVVADDGLQHHALARDINIVVFDDRGTGNGWLLPAGPLREPWHRAHVDMVLHTGQHPAFEGFQASRALAMHGQSAQGEHVPLHTLKNQRLMALAGIAHPHVFFDMLRQQGLPLEHTLALPDHDDCQGLDLLSDPGLTLLCTEKDAVKLFALYPQAGLQLLAVPLVFSPEPAFLQTLDELLAQLKRHPAHPLPSPHGHPTS